MIYMINKTSGKQFLITMLVFTALFQAAVSSAGEYQGVSTFKFLKIDVGARPAAMGGAFAAVADDASANFYNPAGLALLKKKELLAMHNMWFQGINHEYLAAVIPSRKFSVGIDANYLSAGELEKRNYLGILTGNFNPFSYSVGLAAGLSLSDKFKAGIKIKYIEETIFSSRAASAALDAGILYKSRSFSAGVAVLNIGPPLKYSEEDADYQDMKYRLGIAFKPYIYAFSIKNSLVLSLEAQGSIERAPYLCGGFELNLLKEMISLRAGYNPEKVYNTGLTLGAGINLKFVRIDYAYIPYELLGNTQRFSVIMKF